MTLLLEVDAVLLAGFVAAVAWSSAKPTPRAISRSILVLALAFAYLAFWSKVWDTGKDLLSQRKHWQALTPAQAVDLGVPGGVNGSFADWIRGRLGAGQRFYLVPSPAENDSVHQWFTYRLLPNLETDRVDKADWLIFYGTSPKASGYIHTIKGVATQYGPGFSIARVRSAS